MTAAAFRFALAALTAASMAGCSGGRFADFANLNDPRTIVDETIDGRVVTLRQGLALVVRLPAPAGEGYRWALKPLPPTPLASPIRIDLMPGGGIGTVPAAPYSLGLAGLNEPGGQRVPVVGDAGVPAPHVVEGETVLRVRGVAPGNATVQLDYLAVAEPAKPPQKSVRFDVAVVR